MFTIRKQKTVFYFLFLKMKNMIFFSIKHLLVVFTYFLMTNSKNKVLQMKVIFKTYLNIKKIIYVNKVSSFQTNIM